MLGTMYTIGHSTRPLTELIDMLSSNGVKLLVDVRTIPKSRTNPQASSHMCPCMLCVQVPRSFQAKAFDRCTNAQYRRLLQPKCKTVCCLVPVTVAVTSSSCLLCWWGKMGTLNATGCQQDTPWGTGLCHRPMQTVSAGTTQALSI